MQKILQTELFNCRHIDPCEDREDIRNFIVRDERGAGLLSYFQEQACVDENSGTMRTYIVRDNETSEVVGFFSLKAGLISYNERSAPVINEKNGEKVISKETGKTEMRRLFDTLPGVELADFAVNQSYIRKYPQQKGVGFVMYEQFILPLIKEAAALIGIKLIYIFALPYNNLIARYEKYGFMRLEESAESELHSRIKPQYDESCIFMFRML